MNNFLFSFNVVMPIFLIVVIGYFTRKFGLIDDNFVNKAISFNFKIGLSALMFNSVYKTNLSKVFNPKLTIYVFLFICISIVLLCLIIPIFIKDKRKASAIIHTIYRSNFMFLGIPVAINMFGENNIGPVSLLLPIAIPAFNVFAVIMLSMFDSNNNIDKKSKRFKNTIKSIFTNPMILGAIFAILFQLFKIKLPLFITRAISDLSSISTPLALITLGAQFKFESAIKNLKYSIIATIGRLIIIPFIAVYIAILLGFRSYDLGAIFILFSSPSAISCYIMGKEMNSDYELTGDIVLLSTLCSIFTIFFGIYILKSLSFI